MTLERRPQLLTHDHAAVGIESRSSMTLPDNGRLRRYLNLYFIIELLFIL